MSDPALARSAARVRAMGLSELRSIRAMMRLHPSIERVQARAALGYVPQSGLWSRANVEWGFGPKSPPRERDEPLTAADLCAREEDLSRVKEERS